MRRSRARHRSIDATRPRRGARVHRSPQPLRAVAPPRAAPRAEGPPGRDHGGDRRRRQRLRPVRRPRRPPGLRRRSTPASTATRTSPSTGTPSRATSPGSTGRISVNVAFLVGNSALRIAGRRLGRRAQRRPRHRQPWGDAPRGDGGRAFGLSSGLDYPPGSYATTQELAELTREAGRLGGFYHTHVRYPLGDRFLDPFREAIEIGRRGEAPAHITHFYHRKTFPGSPEQMLDLIDDARAEGLDVTFDAYPAEWASTRLLILIPTWVQAGGPGTTKERLADAAVRDRIRRELSERGVLFAGAGGLRRRPHRLLPRPGEHPLGGPDPGRHRRRPAEGPGRRPVRPAPRRGPSPERGHAGPAHRRHPPLPAPPDRDGRHGLDVRRRQAQPADLRQLSRGSSASSCATRRSSGWRRRSGR